MLINLCLREGETFNKNLLNSALQLTLCYILFVWMSGNTYVVLMIALLGFV